MPGAVRGGGDSAAGADSASGLQSAVDLAAAVEPVEGRKTTLHAHMPVY